MHRRAVRPKYQYADATPTSVRADYYSCWLSADVNTRAARDLSLLFTTDTAVKHGFWPASLAYGGGSLDLGF